MLNWKMAAELSQDRHLRLIIARYNEEKLQVERHTVEFHEHDTPEVVAGKLVAFANDISPDII